LWVLYWDFTAKGKTKKEADIGAVEEMKLFRDTLVKAGKVICRENINKENI
jgi:hypothetical protein